jgi:hypothetical protein
MDDQVDAVYVDATGGNVGGDHNPCCSAANDIRAAERRRAFAFRGPQASGYS